MISTNTAYSEIGRTNVIKKIRWYQDLLSEADKFDPAGVNTPPSWNPKVHALAFSLSGTPSLHILEEIANLPPAEN
jgi:hypothetical protein